MKYKVLHVSQSLGGVETYLKNIISNIDLSKFDLKIITPASPSLTSCCKQFGVEHVVLEMERGVNLISDIKCYFFIKSFIKNYKPNLVHCHSSKGGILGRLASKSAKCLSIFTPNGTSYLSFTGLKRIFFFLIEVMVKPFTDFILCVSHSEKNRMQYELGFDSNKIAVVMNATNISPVENLKSIPTTPLIKNDIIKVGTIARLTYQKNPLFLVQVANKMINSNLQYAKKLHFYIYGSGLHDHLLDETNLLISEFGLKDNIHILPWSSSSNVLEYLKNLDVFILPSIFEGLPFSLLEALDLGVPCIVTKCDGCNDVIQNNINGFSGMTPDEFATCINSLITDSETYSRLSCTGIEYVKKNHNNKIFITQLEDYYISIINPN